MAFARTSVIVPALAVLAGLFGAYKLWRTIYKQSSNKTLIIDENEDVEAEVVVELIVEEANGENLENLEGFRDECASPCSAGSPLHPPSLYTPANSSPSSSACSAYSLALWQTNFCDEKLQEEKIHELISSRGSTFAAGSLINPAGSSKSSDGEPTSALLTITEIRENSICGISEISRLTVTDLSSSGISLSQELTNELKMEIDNMKNQLSIYSESFVGLQMGRELGGGTFGTVYEANTRFEKIAVKVLTSKESATLPASADYMSMHDFYAEALVLSSLNHPNILSFEFIISEVSPYGLPGMATELMSDNLHNFIRRAGLKNWNNVWSIANQVANGLKYLHKQKIVHFDIKSSNILLNYSPNMLLCKVADFGLAMKNISGAIGIYSQRGTTHYMAPEVILTSHNGMQSVTEKVDVYSFGILLLELIMGELPYNDMTDDQIEAFVLNGSRPNVPNWCDIGWKGLMEACWNEDQDQRPDFDQIVDHLSCLLGAP